MRFSRPQTNCGGSAVILKRNSRLPNRSNSACESSTQNDRIKYAAFHSTRHSSLQRSDCDIRPKSSLYRGAVSKQNSPVRGSHVSEHRRYSPRKPLSPSVSFTNSHSKKPPEAQGHADLVNANVSAADDDQSMSSDRRGDSSASNDGFEANVIPAVQQSSAVDEDRSSSVNIPPDSVSRSGRSGGVGGGAERGDVEGAGEVGGVGVRSTKTTSETTPSSLLDATTSSANTATTTTATRAAVTIPAVITTTSDNAVYSEALTSVETCLPNADGVLPMAPRRLPSADDDDDKERAVDTSPDGR